MATNFGGVHVGCHCWVPCWGAMLGCHCWVPLLGCHALLGAIAGCHCWVPLLGCHCWVPLREKIDQSVTPFSLAPFSTLITHKLACAIWGYLGSMLVYVFCKNHQNADFVHFCSASQLAGTLEILCLQDY